MESNVEPGLYPWLRADYIQLVDQLSAGKLHHATLLHGVAGLGKRQLIKRFAQRVTCSQPVANKACGQCKSCLLFQAGSHPDHYFIAPLNDKKQISIDQIRYATSKVNETGLISTVRVISIEQLDLLTESAANALLKALEEPPQGVYFLLASAQLNHVPATIASRCYKLNIKTPNPQRLAAWLTKKTNVAVTPQQLFSFENSPLRNLTAIEEGTYQQIAQVEHCYIELITSLAQRSNQPDVIALATRDLVNQLEIAQDSFGGVEVIRLLQLINQRLIKENVAQGEPSVKPDTLLKLSAGLVTLKEMINKTPSINPLLQLQQLIVELSLK
ncbi:DNA polymerase III subunit delta' [Psychrobium sp. 1_MG-2023]|uniref:DNA polymerase III subunit delta' n=1 Tax=Psychrobium sp. 1_MG-2023 TaxID=3062624 RepID=UPI002735E16B|nr:DNA polymerase III subunit delta' [Psychrobium sp. 1_MG-2023]MDP2561685.1 DNA polymerase III subunit delta' [Psychrobium sp. 1_MG-2023]